MRIAEGGAARPISGAEAANGRLDYVQVRQLSPSCGVSCSSGIFGCIDALLLRAKSGTWRHLVTYDTIRHDLADIAKQDRTVCACRSRTGAAATGRTWAAWRWTACGH